MTSKERFLAAVERMRVDRPPVWMMRQAGRHLPEYRELRTQYDFLDLCRRPELAAEISLQPWRRYGTDAVIVFSDILLPAAAMGMKLSVDEGVGSRFETPLRDAQGCAQLVVPHVRRSLAATLEALEMLRFELKDETALIGFVGSPWTIAAYMIEGQGGDFMVARDVAEHRPELLRDILQKISDVVIPFAVEQVRAGADVIQIFDTWGGLLPRGLYEDVVFPKVVAIIEAVKRVGGKTILFAKGPYDLLRVAMKSNVDVIGVPTAWDMKNVITDLGGMRAFQGNLDPEILLRAPHVVETATENLLRIAGRVPGFIANLGHGILPQTSPLAVEAFVRTVKEL